MNESDFENSLRLLQPVEPSPELEGRIALALEARIVPVPAAGTLVRREPKTGGSWRRMWPSLIWATAGACAGVALTLFFRPAAPALASASGFEPSESGREVVSTEEEGTVYGSGSEPARLVRYTSIERHAWTNHSTGAWVQVEVPRQDVVALPVSYQ